MLTYSLQIFELLVLNSLHGVGVQVRALGGQLADDQVAHLVLDRLHVEDLLGLRQHDGDEHTQRLRIQVGGAVVARGRQRVVAHERERAGSELIELGGRLQAVLLVEHLRAGDLRARGADVEQHTQAFVQAARQS